MAATTKKSRHRILFQMRIVVVVIIIAVDDVVAITSVLFRFCWSFAGFFFVLLIWKYFCFHSIGACTTGTTDCHYLVSSLLLVVGFCLDIFMFYSTKYSHSILKKKWNKRNQYEKQIFILWSQLKGGSIFCTALYVQLQ